MRHMGGSKEFCQKGPIYDNIVVVFVMRGSKIPQKVGPYQPTSKMPFIWRFAGVQMMAYH